MLQNVLIVFSGILCKTSLMTNLSPVQSSYMPTGSGLQWNVPRKLTYLVPDVLVRLRVPQPPQGTVQELQGPQLGLGDAVTGGGSNTTLEYRPFSGVNVTL